MPQNIELGLSGFSTFLDFFCLLSGVLVSLPVDQILQSILRSPVPIAELFCFVIKLTNKTAVSIMVSPLAMIFYIAGEIIAKM